MRLFFAWQSDEPLNKAVLRPLLQQICEELDIEYTDDTRDEAGGAHVVDVLLRKIRNSDIFVADISEIGRSLDGGVLSNSNVAYELGFAEGVLGRDRLIMMANGSLASNSTADPYDVAFDFQKRQLTVFKTNRGGRISNTRLLKRELKSKIVAILTAARDNVDALGLSKHEKTLLFWALHIGDNMIIKGYYTERGDFSSEQVLMTGSRLAFSYEGSPFYKAFDIHNAIYFHDAVNKLVSKGLLIESNVSRAYHDMPTWLLSEQGIIHAGAITEAEIYSLPEIAGREAER